MSFINRCLLLTDPVISAAKLKAVTDEFVRGNIQRADVLTDLEVTDSTAESADLQQILDLIMPVAESHSFGNGGILLTSLGTSFDSTDASKGLGLIRVEGRGITGADLFVYRKKNAPTLTWELWRMTGTGVNAGASLGSISDTGGAGDGVVSIPGGIGLSPLASGFHNLRLRVKSATNNDNPTFYSATLILTRNAGLTPDSLFNIIALGQKGVTGYANESACRSRLGMV